MKNTDSRSTEILNEAVLDATRKRLGKRFVSLVVIGSRATGDALPDSDYDAFVFIRGDGKPPSLDFPSLEKRFGIRVGIASKTLKELQHAIGDRSSPFGLMLLNFALGRSKVVGGRNILLHVPNAKTIAKRGLMSLLQADYSYATKNDSPANVFRREPRRHVGFIIAICESLLLAKGVTVKKVDLPKALASRYPKFRVQALIRRALWRRSRWQDISRNKRQIVGARQDMKKFLELYHGLVFR